MLLIYWKYDTYFGVKIREKKKIEKIKNLKKSHGSIQYSSKTTSNKEKKYFFQKKKLNIAWHDTIQHTVLKRLYESCFYYTTLGTTILLVYRSVRRKVHMGTLLWDMRCTCTYFLLLSIPRCTCWENIYYLLSVLYPIINCM